MAGLSPFCFAVLQGVMAPAAWRFQRALQAPAQAQAACLAAVLRVATGSRQASRIPGFTRLRTAREFQEAVPLATYEALASDIADMRRGVSRVLTTEPVLRFEKSGGSSGATKYVPHTRQLLREFHRALAPWLYDVWSQRPATRRGPAYWSLSPIGQKRETTAGGIAVGTLDDSSYFPGAFHTLLRHVLAVPGEVGLLPDVESCRYVTLRYLLDCPHLALMSVWHPSFLTLLMQVFDAHAERLLDDLAQGRCRPPTLAVQEADRSRQQAMAQVLRQGAWQADPQRAEVLRALLRTTPCLPAQKLWPHLALLSMWTEAQAQRFVAPLQQRFAGVEIQGKGLLASEGVVSIPLFAAPAPVLAIRSHFYEFIDLEAPEARPLLAHQLEIDRTYEVVISTGGGLWRYRLGDRVRVVGTLHSTPCLSFVGRADTVSDVVGEKLSATWVHAVLEKASQSSIRDYRLRFVMLAPAMTTPAAYHLYVESDAPDTALVHLAHVVETVLCESHPYQYARQLGQLGAVQAVRVEDAARRYEARCVALGQRAGDVKPVDLHRDLHWDHALAGRRLGCQGARM